MYSVSYIDLNKGQWVRKGSFLKKAVIFLLTEVKRYDIIKSSNRGDPRGG